MIVITVEKIGFDMARIEKLSRTWKTSTSYALTVPCRQCTIFDRLGCRSPSDLRKILPENNFRKKSDEKLLNAQHFFLSKVLWLTDSTWIPWGFPPPPWPHIALRSVYFEYRKRISQKSQSGGLQPLVDGAEGFNTTREACKAGAFWAFFFLGGDGHGNWVKVCLGEKMAKRCRKLKRNSFWGPKARFGKDC